MLVSRLQSNGSADPSCEADERGRDTAGSYGLSDRELQVLQCVSDGLSNREIAEKLYLSEGTVKNYISSIYSKMDVRDRVQAARKAHDEGIV
jgi:DNA-binding NarL/FixJ family response regulator